MSSLAASIPPISKDFLERLLKAFPRVEPRPNITTMDELMWSGGNQEVLQWVLAHGSTESIVTNADVSRTVNVRAR